MISAKVCFSLCLGSELITSRIEDNAGGLTVRVRRKVHRVFKRISHFPSNVGCFYRGHYNIDILLLFLSA